jgi:hypothetical protein
MPVGAFSIKRRTDHTGHPNGHVSMAVETTDCGVGIHRCQGALQTFFALTLMELGKFEWRRPNSHEWEVGRWSGLRLTLLARPEWGPHRPEFAICPVPGDCEEVPFILLLSIKGRINNLVSEVQQTSVIPINLSVAELQRDVGCAAHRVFDVAIKLQRAQLETRYARWRQGALPNLPCMKSLMKLQRSYTAPMSGWSEPLSPD